MATISSGKSFTAADKLRDLLTQLDRQGSPSSPTRHSSSPKAFKDTPKSNELYLLVQASDEISHRLSHENEALRNDNAKLRSNVVALVEENNRLHEEIRSTFVSDMLRLINIDEGQSMTDKESQIADLYTKKMRHLEIELKDAKEKLSMYETVWQAPNDLMNCLKCGALLPFGQHSTEHNEKFANILTENESNKRKLQQIQVKFDEAQTKEQSALAKLQECIQIAEQSQFEKNEAVVERDQTRIELVETQKRLKKFIDEMNETINVEKQKAEKLCDEKVKENSEKMRQTEERCSQYELTIDRLAREKTSLAADLDEWKNRIHRQEIDLSQASDSVKLQIQKAMRERDQANSNTMQIRTDFEKLLLQSNQDILQLRHQLGSSQNRFNDIEGELLNSKKHCLELTEEINRLTRENLMLKSIKQTLERSREENIDAITVILNKREEDFRTTIEKLELERHQSLSYLEDLVCNQNTILNKLRLHSRQLTCEIETLLEQKQEIVQEMTVENQELRMKLSNAYERLEQTDTQLLQHNETHVKLKHRIIDLNNKMKEYENIINQIKTKDLIDYQQRLALMSQRS
ncbi:unnamed protein product [Rotaria magnacalcarata]|uniref:Uncharacterized protein n=2 Tax=Rotaria magnacalcarata TaxID=392030 RepID=A0A817AGK7_9BILA|nr:unnamed protein product [Rotaria magnacalcarata]CAF1607369.1 unnamed protein product [Rotaria magnacalcarata]CAF2030651.1 unnamed protein product [Rotaria magnacalcarata]CAF2125646.1 unnamed protein product [Rotaria magnacalcarata]CAF2268244.1 unnamed protein product [Rotaria magnacalcarata]